jgi:hypothetical protein
MLAGGLASVGHAQDKVPSSLEPDPQEKSTYRPPDGGLVRPTFNPRLAFEHRIRAQKMIAKAITYLRSQQDPETGGWRVNKQGPTFPAVTGLVLTGMLFEPGISDADPAVSRGLDFILASQQADGGIYRGVLPSYNTAICLVPLGMVTRTEQRAQVIAKAQDFLKGLQYGEGAMEYVDMAESAQKVDKDHAYYGGVGYGNRGRPDLSNLSFSIEGLRATGVSPDDPFMKRAIVFLERCQMQESVPDGESSKPVNTMAYAKGSYQGGFIYATSVNKDHVGVGQSFAGEILESLSGGPGSEVRLTFKTGEDKKPVTLAREKILERLRGAIDAIPELKQRTPAPDLIVVLGPSSDGVSANVVRIRANIGAPKMREIVAATFKAEIADESAVLAKTVPQWQGSSQLRAYGSMTYSGFKSYLYAGLSINDPRVQAAVRWISDNYTLEENPGMGTDGYYYYLLVFSKALAAMGDYKLLAFSGGGNASQPLWRNELIEKLETLQNEDGSFKSIDDRWMEDDSVLITAYALQALQFAAR